MRITPNAVVRQLGVPSKWFDKLPRCKAAIREHTESYPLYWGRAVVWAVQVLKKNGEVVCWKGIRKLTNLNRKNFLSCLMYVDKFTDHDTAALIQSLAD